MTHFGPTLPPRIADYTGPRYGYTSDVREMPRRCEHETCYALSEHTCAATGEPLCEDHAFPCECNACFAAGLMYRLEETVLIEDLRLYRRHAHVPLSEEEQ